MDGWWPNGLMSVGSLSPFASLPSLPTSLRQMFHTGEKRHRLCLTEWRKAHCTGEKSTLHTALGRKAEWRKPFSGQIATSATTGTPTPIQPIRNELGLLAKLTPWLARHRWKRRGLCNLTKSLGRLDFVFRTLRLLRPCEAHRY